jgi:predicted negative regulator of RcsB-dependent stress response
MKLKLVVLLIALIRSITPSNAASYVYDYSALCQAAYQHYMALHLSQGNAAIRQELKSNPYNLMATYIADYEDCLLLLFNGDTRDYDQRYGHLEDRLKLLSKGDERSPWHRLCKAGVYFHWALVHVRFGEHFKATTTFRKSFLLIKENQKLFPNFEQNKIFLGVEEAVVGTIPDDYKWLASVFGMKGSVKKGIAQITSFINKSESGAPLRNEAIIYYCYLKFYLLSQQEEVWNFINSNQFVTRDNLFNTFIKANLALNFRKGDAAIQALQVAQQDEEYKRFPVFDYEMGFALQHKLDPSANEFFNRFLSRYKGRIFVKETWQQMAFAYFLQNDIGKANNARSQILKVGTKQVDADKQAQRFAESGIWPTPSLLEARLLIDGGYYIRALKKLQGYAFNTLSTADKLEYYFRLARIQDELGNDDKALSLYQTTINFGKTRKEHFAARSALQMAMLYEKRGSKTEALTKYNECLSMKNHDFQSNIDQQAKAGVNRLIGK